MISLPLSSSNHQATVYHLMSPSAEEIIAKSTAAANSLFPLAQQSVVYRASIAYLLQHVKAFVAAIQGLKTHEFTPSEVQAFQRFNGLVTHFSNILPHLGEKWLSAILNWPSVHVHNYIAGFRKTLIEICQQLSLDPAEVIKYDKMQDVVNKCADLQHLKKALRRVRESNISIPNAVDVQQLIETRLRSVQQHLPKKATGKGLSQQPSSDSIPICDLQKKMDQELSVFRSIDIPCDDLQIDDTLGCGGFGTVYKATRLSTAELLAVKEVRSDRLTMATWASLYSEVATMAELRHKYVLELVGAHVKEPYRIITRFCPGKSVFDRLHRTQGSQLTPHELTSIAYQVAEGMRFLHENGIVHRDLKTMNILLDDLNIAKIADFGLAGMMKAGEDLKGGVGTPHYTAPEILERKRYGPKVDTYSFGVILWEMANRQIPYREKTHQEIYEHVVVNNKRLPQSSCCPEPLWKLITRCWQQNPNDRPEFSEIVELFVTGQVYFKGGTRESESTLEIREGCPPLDTGYLLSVLANQTHKQFTNVVEFLVNHIDHRMVHFLRNKHVLSKYDTEQENASSVLLLASVLLKEKEFEEFIEKFASKVIDAVLEKDDPVATRACAAFCLKVPAKYFALVKKYVRRFVEKIQLNGVGHLVVQFIAKLPEAESREFKDDLIFFFDPSGIAKVTDQETLNAVAKLFPMFAEDLDGFQVVQFIPLLELALDIPSDLIRQLVKKTGDTAGNRLILAVLKAAYRTDVTESLTELLKMVNESDLEQFSQQFEVFDDIQKLILQRKSIRAALLLLFRLTMVPCITPILANHPLLMSVLQVRGHVAQRLQIFTSLFANEQFCSDTTISDGVWKLLVSSLNVERLIPYCLRFMAALSSHQTGCALIIETGMLTLFTQMFLSSMSGDTSTSLTILTNMAKVTPDIPQLSLIISCLMQDLLCTVTNKCDILQTLIHLVEISPASVQDHDLQKSVLPLLSPRQEPVIVILAMRLLDSCEMQKLKLFYDKIAQRVYNILCTDTMMYPELLASAVGLISSLSSELNMTTFLIETQFMDFIDDILPQMAAYPEAHKRVSNCIYLLKRALADAEGHSPTSPAHDEVDDNPAEEEEAAAEPENDKEAESPEEEQSDNDDQEEDNSSSDSSSDSGSDSDSSSSSESESA